MTMPTGPEESTPHTERWRVEDVWTHRDPDGSGITVKVRDRLVRNDVVTDEYRDRELTEAEADSLWESTTTKTYKEWVTLIHSSADLADG